MKRKFFLISILFTFSIEIIILIIFWTRTPNLSQDIVDVNEVVQSVTQDFETLDIHQNHTTLDYVVLDNNEEILYKTSTGLSENINSAIRHQDTILDIKMGGEIIGKVIIFNNESQAIYSQKQNTMNGILLILIIQLLIFIIYTVYMHQTMIHPFQKLKGFAERIAGGNLDIPLEMDRYNLFGAFTESFDIMRTELKKARLAEAQANASKKELVAKLSHDIKTPIASIKAVSEVGLAVTEKDKDKKNYNQIIEKADQINRLIMNLFTATLEELQQLTVEPKNIESKQVQMMLDNADYLHYASIPTLPDCLVYADGLRLQQVFDNIFSNSYKYAKTDILVIIEETDEHLNIIIEDYGGGVLNEELYGLKEKYKRGSNAKNIEGAGLGLYISDYFMKQMQGDLKIENGSSGLKVTISLLLSKQN